MQAFAGIDPTLDDETEEFQEGGALPPWLYLEETPEREERKETPIAGKGFFKSGLEVPFSGGGEFSNGGDFSGGGAFSGGGEYFPDFATPAGGGGAGAGGGGSGGSSGDGGGGGGSSGGGGGTSGGGGVSTGGGGASYNGPVGEPGVLTDEERAALADQQAGIWLDIFEQAGLIVDGQLAFDPLVGGEFNIPPDQQAAVNAMLDQFIADMEAQGIPISPELQAWIDSARNGVLIIDPIDPRSAAALEGITPEMQGMTVVYVTMVNRQLPDGVRYTIVEGFRTLERQAALYSIGRTTELDRAPVTYGAPSPCCPHYRGIAVDGYLFTDDGSAFASDPALYPVLGASTDMLGLDWGGDWGMRDMPHVQLDI